MYAAVPSTTPGRVAKNDPVARSSTWCGVEPPTLAMPKSRIFTSPSSVTMMFSGLRSRWTIWRGVGFRQAVGDLRSDGEHGRHRQCPAGQELAQRLAFDELHRDIHHLIGRTDLEDRDDVRDG